MWRALQARQSRSITSGRARLTAVLTAPLPVGLVTAARISRTAVAYCSSAGMPARATLGPVSLSRAAASASDSGQSAAASVSRSARRWMCGAPRSDHEYARAWPGPYATAPGERSTSSGSRAANASAAG